MTKTTRQKIAVGISVLAYVAGTFSFAYLRKQGLQTYLNFVRQVYPAYRAEKPIYDNATYSEVSSQNHNLSLEEISLENIIPANILSPEVIIRDSLQPELFPPRTDGTIPILSIHLVTDQPNNNSMTPQKFASRLGILYENGYYLVNLSDVIERKLDEVVPAGRRPLILTFDDCSYTHLSFVKRGDGNIYVDPNTAVGILQQFSQKYPDFGYAGAFFIDFDNPPFGNTETASIKIQYLVRQGFELGAHSISGRNFSEFTLEEIQDEMAQSKIFLEALSERPVLYFAVPGGFLPEEVNPLDILSFDYKDNVNIEFVAFLKITNSVNPSPNDPEFLSEGLLKRWELKYDEEFSRFLAYRKTYVSDGIPDNSPVIESDR